jgi:8-oxo-dGTP pyrophosphatase MutT (NUDIX family)
MRGGGIEFLLVQTRGGRWIFPKGGVEPGLTHAESAALEAFEEAGVHGRMEKISFARYFRKLSTAIPKTRAQSGRRPPEAELAVAAHLCEVSKLEPPQEAGRNPTWFSADKAKQRLLKDRATEFGAELVRVVDRALSRIERLHAGRHTPERGHPDGLQKVRFEALEDGRLHDDLRKAVLARYFLRQPVLRLGTGINSSADNVTAIDSARRANLPKPGNSSAGKYKAATKLGGSRTGRPSN